MRSIDGSQSGQSLVDVVVASALLAIGVVVGLTALDTASFAARQAVWQTWAQCAVRTESEAVLAADWSPSGAYPAPTNVVVSALADPKIANLQRVTVTAYDPRSSSALSSATFLKPMRLSGTRGVDAAAVQAGCRVPPS